MGSARNPKKYFFPKEPSKTIQFGAAFKARQSERMN